MLIPLVVVLAPRKPVALDHLQVLVARGKVFDQRRGRREGVVAGAARRHRVAFDLTRGQNGFSVVRGVDVPLEKRIRRKGFGAGGAWVRRSEGDSGRDGGGGGNGSGGGNVRIDAKDRFRDRRRGRLSYILSRGKGGRAGKAGKRS